jgi:hypothetical protein
MAVCNLPPKGVQPPSTNSMTRATQTKQRVTCQLSFVSHSSHSSCERPTNFSLYNHPSPAHPPVVQEAQPHQTATMPYAVCDAQVTAHDTQTKPSHGTPPPTDQPLQHTFNPAAAATRFGAKQLHCCRAAGARNSRSSTIHRASHHHYPHPSCCCC